MPATPRTPTAPTAATPTSTLAIPTPTTPHDAGRSAGTAAVDEHAAGCVDAVRLNRPEPVFGEVAGVGLAKHDIGLQVPRHAARPWRGRNRQLRRETIRAEIALGRVRHHLVRVRTRRRHPPGLKAITMVRRRTGVGVGVAASTTGLARSTNSRSCRRRLRCHSSTQSITRAFATHRLRRQHRRRSRIVMRGGPPPVSRKDLGWDPRRDDVRRLQVRPIGRPERWSRG
jgi:hypothetical protein